MYVTAASSSHEYVSLEVLGLCQIFENIEGHQVAMLILDEKKLDVAIGAKVEALRAQGPFEIDGMCLTKAIIAMSATSASISFFRRIFSCLG
jgi:hypothetical protein